MQRVHRQRVPSQTGDSPSVGKVHPIERTRWSRHPPRFQMPVVRTRCMRSAARSLALRCVYPPASIARICKVRMQTLEMVNYRWCCQHMSNLAHLGDADPGWFLVIWTLVIRIGCTWAGATHRARGGNLSGDASAPGPRAAAGGLHRAAKCPSRSGRQGQTWDNVRPLGSTHGTRISSVCVSLVDFRAKGTQLFSAIGLKQHSEEMSNYKNKRTVV